MSKNKKYDKPARPFELWNIGNYETVYWQERDDQIPFYPYMCLFVEHSTGFIIDSLVAEHGEYMEEFQDTFLSIIEYNEMIPKEVLVKREEAYILFKQITEELGIKFRLVNKLKWIKKVRKELVKQLKKKQSADFYL